LMFKLTEQTLEQEVASIIANELNCQWITQGSVKEGQFDVLLLINDLRLVIELEIGKGFTKFGEGIVQANGYKEKLKADGIITLMYPKEARRVVASQQDVKDIALGFNPQALILSPILNYSYKEIGIVDLAKIMKAQIAKAALTVSPSLVVSALRDCVQSISLFLRKKIGIEKPSVDSVVGSFDLFKILAGEEDKVDKKKERDLQIATCDLTSYILINQLLLYQLLSTPLKLVPLREIKSFSELSKMLKGVTDVDYKAVYSVDVIQTMPSTALSEVNKAIIALRALKPEYIPHDLLGRVFHEFLPFETRKLLGTFYTKPVAAEILAAITIEKGSEIVIDPACGSGTLIVAAYSQKMLLDAQRSHKAMVEREIIGIDIMPFAAHLAALNLTLQNVLQTTDKTQVGIGNSLNMKPGNRLTVVPKQLEMFSESIKGVDKDILRQEGLGFTIPDKVDVVIMNPPFTRKERLDKDMKGMFLNSFDKPQNYWAYFLSFSDGVLDIGGKIGAVLPRDFVAGQYSEGVRKRLFKDNDYIPLYVTYPVFSYDIN
jgi:predicted RNA methylase